MRNALLDWAFYDIQQITPAEGCSLAPWLAREGALLIVPPTGMGALRRCRDLDHFAQRGGCHVRALAIAGVGSSALGSAAFARNVADAFGKPVAASVSGYGLADLVTEALGGWFWFGGLNRLRHWFEPWDDLLGGIRSAQQAAGADGPYSHLVHASRDTRTLAALLGDRRFQMVLLTGHSKGNLVIAEALGATGEAAANTWIVTLSALVAVPDGVRAIQVLGRNDWFGRLNAVGSLKPDLAPSPGLHHTNTELWWHLPVTRLFRELRESHGISLH